MRILFALALTALMILLTNFSMAHATLASVASAPCSLTSEGIFRGSWVKHRILVDQDIVYGANDMDAILTQLDNLRNRGFCQ